MKTFRGLILSCEHGGTKVPAPYLRLFKNADSFLRSHRGSDMGALTLAKALSKKMKAPLFFSTTTRLLVDLNRSVGHKDLYSEFTRRLPRSVRQEIISSYWAPYRSELEDHILKASRRSSVLHISSHSFTPRLHGVRRQADIGLLYDPKRKSEKAFAKTWRLEIQKIRPDLKVRLNYPYQGKADGVMKTLRGLLPWQRYAGIELEVNQKHLAGKNRFDPQLQKDLMTSLERALKTKRPV